MSSKFLVALGLLLSATCVSAQSSLHVRFTESQVILESPLQIYSMPWVSGAQSIREEGNQWLIRLDTDQRVLDIFNYQPALLLVIGQSVSLPAGGSSRIAIEYQGNEAFPKVVTSGKSVPIPKYHQMFSAEQQSIKQLISTVERTLQSFPVVLKAQPAEAGKVIGTGQFKENSYVHYQAIPVSEEFVFSHWEGVPWQQNHGTHMVTEAIQASAVFKPTVRIDIVDQDGKLLSRKRIPKGEQLTVEPPSEPERVFLQWLGEGTPRPGNWNISASSDMVLRAKMVDPKSMEPIRIKLRSNPPTVAETFGSGTYRPGTAVQYYTTPVRPNYMFSHWEGTDWTEARGDFIATKDLEATAVYKETFHVKIVAGSETLLDKRVKAGEKVSFAAPLLENHLFLGWTGDLSGKSAQDSVVVEGDLWSEAKYEKLHVISLINNVNNSKKVLRQRKGEPLEISAPEITGHEFSKWSDGQTEPTRTITVRGDREVKAIYSKIHKLSLSVAPDDLQVELVGAGTYSEGTEVEVLAPEIAGYTFLQWDGDLAGKSSQDKVIVRGDMHATAFYRKKDMEKAELLKPYLINAGDILSINFDGVIQTSKVDWQGRALVLPVGKTKVYELTRSQATTKINQALSEVLGLDTSSTVQVVSGTSSSASIEGGVNRPELFRLPLGQDITLADMVVAGGGFSINADRNNITIRSNEKVAFVRYDQAKDKKIEPGNEILVGTKEDLTTRKQPNIKWEPLQLQP
jgi:protein involved in polysaccharide export with SLBB domain